MMAIPKVIHYCWFGGNPKPKFAKKCIDSWRKHCPDYQIIEWNEDNFDITQNRYCKEAYEEGKWAFVTDYARLKILFENGGFYFDTDVELVKNLDAFLEEPCFMCIESSTRCVMVATGLGIGAQKGNAVVKALLDSYEGVAFRREDGSLDTATCTVRNNAVLKRFGFTEENRLQRFPEFTIYPSEFFSPIEMESGIKRKTKNTYSIHHYSLSWTSKENQRRRRKWLLQRRIGDFSHAIRHLPNAMLLAMLGRERYEELKTWIKSKTR